jgi:23S rRNA pseudouridine1911/1915/1917 synthase
MPQSVKAPASKRLSATADASHDGQRLDRFLSERLPELSRTRVQNLIRQGHVCLGSATIVDVKYRVKPGDRFALSLPPAAPAEPAAETIPLNVVYEDDALIVIDKPAGLVVHPGAGQAGGTLVNALIAHCGDSLSGIGGVARPGIVHRLDKDTSGVLVVAKTERALKGLQAQFAAHGRDGLLARAYLAFVWGRPARAQGAIDAPIGRHPQHRTKMAVRPRDGRPAVTRYRVIESFPAASERPAASLVRCQLETGRTHQIRVHFAHIGHPLMGDATYGGGFRTAASRLDDDAQAALSALARQALHAAELGFRHPATGEDLRFSSPLPADLQRLSDALHKMTLT